MLLKRWIRQIASQQRKYHALAEPNNITASVLRKNSVGMYLNSTEVPILCVLLQRGRNLSVIDSSYGKQCLELTLCPASVYIHGPNFKVPYFLNTCSPSLIFICTSGVLGHLFICIAYYHTHK